MTSSIRKDYFWNTLGVLLQNALSPLLLIVITRINGIYDSGIFSFAFSIAIIFWALAMWGGRTYQVSDTKKIFDGQSYIVTRLILAILIVIAAVLFCWFNNYDILKTGIIVSLVFLKVVESIADAIYGVMQTNDHLYIAGRSLAYKSIIGLSLFIVINVVTRNVLISCLSLVLVNALFVIFYDIPKTQKLQSIIIYRDKVGKYLDQAIEIMRRCFALCMVSFLAAFSLNIPRYYLDQYQPSELGYFGIIAMPVTLVVLLMTFILQPNMVNLSRQLNRRDLSGFNSTIVKIINHTFAVGIGVLIVTYFAGVPLLTFIFGADFSNYKAALLIITMGAIASALVAIFINMLTIMRCLSPQVYVLFLTNLALIGVYAAFVSDVNMVSSVGLFSLTTAIQALLLGYIYGQRIRKMKHEAA